MKILLIGAFFILFSVIFFRIYRRDIIFSIVLFWMFAYCIFSMIAYLYYPEDLIIRSGGQYYGLDIFYDYYIYIVASFVMIGIFYFILNAIKPCIIMNTVNAKIEFSRIIFYIIMMVYIFIMTFFLIKNYGELSYDNQRVMKDNKIWFYLYTTSGVFILALLNDIVVNKKNKLVKSIFMVVLFTVVIWTSLKSGQRIELFMIGNILMVYFLTLIRTKENNGKTIKRIPMKQKVKLGIIIIIFIVFFQIIRTTRGDIQEILNLDFKKLMIVLFDMKTIVFQDWFAPSLSLITCMQFHVIQPIEVVKSNILNIFSFIFGGYPSLGESFSRYVDPNGITGYGYYFLTEGYQLVGSLGFIVSSFLIVFYYRCYRVLLLSRNNDNYNCYMSGIIALYIISIVRGQSLFFIKGIMFYIIPAIFLYFLQFGKLPMFYKNK